MRLLYPPHPAITWSPQDLHRLSGFIVQLKYNDWRTLVYFLPDGRIEFYNRKKRKFSRYRPPAAMIESLRKLALPRGRWHVLDGGLLHYNTPRVRDTLVLWDVLVLDGEYLLGTKYRERYRLLRRITGLPKKAARLDGVEVGLVISRHLWLAPNLKGSPKQLFDRVIRLPEIEGLVLKNDRAPLERCHREQGNARWQIRVRRPRIDYRF